MSNRAEQSLLGCLFVDPATRQQTFSLVRVEDFADPWHAAVYVALRQTPDGDILEVAAALAERVGPPVTDRPRMHLLIHDLPVRPDPAGYALMVIDASLRRQVSQLAVLVQACGASDAQASAPMERITGPVKGLVAAMTQRHDHARHVLGGVRVLSEAGAATTRPIAADALHEWCLAADRVLSDRPLVDVAAVRDAEVRFIGSLFSATSRIEPWAQWIRPQWLSARSWAPVLNALQQRAEAGESLDVVSVGWEVQRSSRRHGPGPGLDAIKAAAEAACWQDPDYLGRRVAGHLMTRVADTAATSIRSAADHPGLALPDVLHTVSLMVDVVERAAQPLTGPAPASSAGAAPQQGLPAPIPSVPAAPAIGW